MRVVVTGADGSIGRRAVDHFADLGWEVVGVGIGPRPATTRAAVWITRDLAAEGLEPEELAGVSAVMHLAAIPGRMGEDRAVFRNNVCATYNVLDSAGAAGVRRAVFASSISIYGIVWADGRAVPSELPLSEGSPLPTTESYSLSKEVDETTAAMMTRRYGMSIAALRFPLVQEEADIRSRSEQVRADRSEGHKELWAYLTFDDATRALELAVSAEFDGLLVVNAVSPQALAGLDALAVAVEFYPEVAVHDGSGHAYTTDAARDRIGFVGRSIL